MQEPPPSDLPPLTTAPVQRTSLWIRLCNVFATPGEVFDEVCASPYSALNWLMPVVLACLVGITYGMVVFSQESVLQQVREQQERVLEQKLSKLPPQQRQQAMEVVAKTSSPVVLKGMAAAGAVFGSFAWLFVVALVLWAEARLIFGARAEYLKAVELTGLAGMIGVLGALVGMLLVTITGRLDATLGPALFMSSSNPADKVRLALASLNVITLWYIALLALGLMKLAKTSYAKAALGLFLPWLLVRAGLILSGLAARGV